MLTRSQERDAAQAQLHAEKTSFGNEHSQIVNDELQRTTSDSQHLNSDNTDAEHLPSASPAEPPTADSQVPTNSKSSCPPSHATDYAELTDSPDSGSNQAVPPQKRDVSQVTSSSPKNNDTRQSTLQTHNRQNILPYSHIADQFCTQRCLLGLQQDGGGLLDEHCPNLKRHQQGNDSNNRHLITAKDLLEGLKQQLDETIDRAMPLGRGGEAIPLGGCGHSGEFSAPFKLTCIEYGYTVYAKGTTKRLWKKLAREVDFYRILRRAQGSAVPVCLGPIDLNKIYFLHGVGEIRHMLIMGWGGINTAKLGRIGDISPKDISKSKDEIRSLGVKHQELKRHHMLWNEELDRVLIIDFHRAELDPRPMQERMRSLKKSRKRSSSSREGRKAKVLRVV